MIFSFKSFIASLILFIFLTANAAMATIVTLDFTGTLNSDFGEGTAFSGSYTLDTAVAPRSGSNAQFAAFDNLIDAHLTIGGFAASIGPSSGLPEIQQDDIAGADRYGLLVRNVTGSSQILGLNLTDFTFRLDDVTGTAIDDAQILLNPPSLSAFSSNSFFLFLNDSTGNNFNLIDGTLSSLNLRPSGQIPEPSILALLLLATGVMTASRLIRKRVHSY